jgi:hypothetical protein
MLEQALLKHGDEVAAGLVQGSAVLLALATAGLAGELLGLGSLEALAAGGTAVATEEAVAAGVPLAEAIKAGLVSPDGKLAQVLGGIEGAFERGAPKTALEALSMVKNATSAVGLEPGIASLRSGGQVVLQNVGGVTTTLGTNGSILVQRGSDTLLHLVP